MAIQLPQFRRPEKKSTFWDYLQQGLASGVGRGVGSALGTIAAAPVKEYYEIKGEERRAKAEDLKQRQGAYNLAVSRTHTHLLGGHAKLEDRIGNLEVGASGQLTIESMPKDYLINIVSKSLGNMQSSTAIQNATGAAAGYDNSVRDTTQVLINVLNKLLEKNPGARAEGTDTTRRTVKSLLSPQQWESVKTHIRSGYSSDREAAVKFLDLYGRALFPEKPEDYHVGRVKAFREGFRVEEEEKAAQSVETPAATPAATPAEAPAQVVGSAVYQRGAGFKQTDVGVKQIESGELVLGPNTRGPVVEGLSRALWMIGGGSGVTTNGRADDRYGPGMVKRVGEIQAEAGLNVTGQLDSATLNAIKEKVKALPENKRKNVPSEWQSKALTGRVVVAETGELQMDGKPYRVIEGTVYRMKGQPLMVGGPNGSLRRLDVAGDPFAIPPGKVVDIDLDPRMARPTGRTELEDVITRWNQEGPLSVRPSALGPAPAPKQKPMPSNELYEAPGSNLVSEPSGSSGNIGVRRSQGYVVKAVRSTLVNRKVRRSTTGPRGGTATSTAPFFQVVDQRIQAAQAQPGIDLAKAEKHALQRVESLFKMIKGGNVNLSASDVKGLIAAIMLGPNGEEDPEGIEKILKAFGAALHGGARVDTNEALAEAINENTTFRRLLPNGKMGEKVTAIEFITSTAVQRLVVAMSNRPEQTLLPHWLSGQSQGARPGDISDRIADYGIHGLMSMWMMRPGDDARDSVKGLEGVFRRGQFPERYEALLNLVGLTANQDQVGLEYKGTKLIHVDGRDTFTAQNRMANLMEMVSERLDPTQVAEALLQEGAMPNRGEGLHGAATPLYSLVYDALLDLGKDATRAGRIEKRSQDVLRNWGL